MNALSTATDLDLRNLACLLVKRPRSPFGLIKEYKADECTRLEAALRSRQMQWATVCLYAIARLERLRLLAIALLQPDVLDALKQGSEGQLETAVYDDPDWDAAKLLNLLINKQADVIPEARYLHPEDRGIRLEGDSSIGGIDEPDPLEGEKLEPGDVNRDLAEDELETDYVPPLQPEKPSKSLAKKAKGGAKS